MQRNETNLKGNREYVAPEAKILDLVPVSLIAASNTETIDEDPTEYPWDGTN